MTSILLVGSYVVPLAVILVFIVLYVRRYKKYLLHKNSYTDCVFFAGCLEAYIFARLEAKKCQTGPSLWWYLFGSKYIDMVNLYSERCVYELDQLNSFEPTDGRPCFTRKAFMSHWKEIHAMLFDQKSYGWGSGTTRFRLYFKFGDDPFGSMNDMIQSKLLELYKKQALLILRKDGFREFSEFLHLYDVKSCRYAQNIPFSIITSASFHEKIVSDHSVEIGERIRQVVRQILGKDRLPTNESQVQKLESLTESFLLKGKIPGDVHYNSHYPGFSEARNEVFELLKEVSVEK